MLQMLKYFPLSHAKQSLYLVGITWGDLLLHNGRKKKNLWAIYECMCGEKLAIFLTHRCSKVQTLKILDIDKWLFHEYAWRTTNFLFVLSLKGRCSYSQFMWHILIFIRHAPIFPVASVRDLLCKVQLKIWNVEFLSIGEKESFYGS